MFLGFSIGFLSTTACSVSSASVADMRDLILRRAPAWPGGFPARRIGDLSLEHVAGHLRQVPAAAARPEPQPLALRGLAAASNAFQLASSSARRRSRSLPVSGRPSSVGAPPGTPKSVPAPPFSSWTISNRRILGPRFSVSFGARTTFRSAVLVEQG